MTEDKNLILWGWINPQIVNDVIICEIENNCKQYGIYYPNAYEVFLKNKSAPNSLYFCHSYAPSDIPMGQEYTQIAYMENSEIQKDSIQQCHAKILCFFTAYHTQPSENAMRGHHEFSLIQFEQEIPKMIYENLPEITQLPFSPQDKQIMLC